MKPDLYSKAILTASTLLLVSLLAFLCTPASGQAKRTTKASFQPEETTNTLGTGKPVNPIAFEIRGLRLGMTPDEARPIMENLAREYKSPVIGWPPQELVGEGQSPCLSETVTAMKEHRETNSGGGHEKCITTMYFRAHEYAEVINAGRPRIDLSFAEDLPIAPGTTRLWRITYIQDGLQTVADIRSFFAELIKKFGPATFASLTGPVVYCSETAPGKTCRFDNQCSLSPDLYSQVSGRQVPRLASSGLCAMAVPDRGTVDYRGTVDLWDEELVGRSDKEKKKVIDETRTTIKPTF